MIEPVWGRVALLFWLLAVLFPASVSAQAPEVEARPLAAYRTLLSEVHALLVQPGAGESELDAARTLLDPWSAVTLPSGEQIELAPLLGGRTDALAAGEALARVKLVMTQLDAATSDDAAARIAALERVLADPSFGPQTSWLQQALRWLSEWLGNRLPAPQSGASTVRPWGVEVVEVLGKVLAAGGGIAILALLVYLLRGLLEDFVPDFRFKATEENADSWPQSPQAARTRAARLAETGDFRQAVRQLYLSALLTMEERGLVVVDRSLTNREMLAHVPNSHPVRPHLQPVVDTFDEVWYGMHEPDAATFTTYGASIDALNKVVSRERD